MWTRRSNGSSSNSADENPFSYRKLQTWRWFALIFNVIIAATYVVWPKWSALFFVPFHVGLGGWVFWFCGRRLREMARQQAVWKLTRGATRWND